MGLGLIPLAVQFRSLDAFRRVSHRDLLRFDATHIMASRRAAAEIACLIFLRFLGQPAGKSRELSAWTAAHGLCYASDSVVVHGLAA